MEAIALLESCQSPSTGSWDVCIADQKVCKRRLNTMSYTQISSDNDLNHTCFDHHERTIPHSVTKVGD